MNVFRSGFCDGLLGRESCNDNGWDKCQQYLIGYFQGTAKRKEMNITLKIERLK
jgi:hypothetical protein